MSFYRVFVAGEFVGIRIYRIRDRQLIKDFLQDEMVHSLVNAFQLFPKLNVIRPDTASEDEIRLFHSEDYVDFLQSFENEHSNSDSGSEDNYGLGTVFIIYNN